MKNLSAFRKQVEATFGTLSSSTHKDITEGGRYSTATLPVDLGLLTIKKNKMSEQLLSGFAEGGKPEDQQAAETNYLQEIWNHVSNGQPLVENFQNIETRKIYQYDPEQGFTLIQTQQP